MATRSAIDSAQALGRTVRTLRKTLGITQPQLALTSGTGLRFIVDLEKGKPTCQVGKILQVLRTLGAAVVVETSEKPDGAKA
jgi:y4mF family transcriptional regulator